MTTGLSDHTKTKTNLYILASPICFEVDDFHLPLLPHVHLNQPLTPLSLIVVVGCT